MFYERNSVSRIPGPVFFPGFGGGAVGLEAGAAFLAEGGVPPGCRASNQGSGPCPPGPDSRLRRAFEVFGVFPFCPGAARRRVASRIRRKPHWLRDSASSSTSSGSACRRLCPGCCRGPSRSPHFRLEEWRRRNRRPSRRTDYHNHKTDNAWLPHSFPCYSLRFGLLLSSPVVFFVPLPLRSLQPHWAQAVASAGLSYQQLRQRILPGSA